jgi:hypothetical protein
MYIVIIGHGRHEVCQLETAAKLINDDNYEYRLSCRSSKFQHCSKYGGNLVLLPVPGV